MLKCLDNEQEEAAIILFMFSHARRDFAAFNVYSVYEHTAFTVAKMNDESLFFVCAFYLVYVCTLLGYLHAISIFYLSMFLNRSTATINSSSSIILSRFFLLASTNV